MVILMIIIIFLFAVIWILTTYPMDPTGNYENDKSGFAGTAYFQFKNGKVVDVYLESDGTEHRNDLGSYFKQNKKWVYAPTNAQTMSLRATPFSIQIGAAEGTVNFKRIFGQPKPIKKTSLSKEER